MKVQKVKIDDKTVTHIFISDKEADNEECKNQIQQFKKENENVVVFQAGQKSIKESFKYMLQFQKNKVEVN